MIAILLGTVVGLLLGLTGAGGSVLAVPLLMVGLHWSITQASTVALLAVATSATLGTVIAWRHSYVRYRAASMIALAGAFTAPLGIRLADRLSEPVLEAAFAAVLLIVSVRMFRMTLKAGADAIIVRATVSGEGLPAGGDCCQINPLTGRMIWNWLTFRTMASIGLATGFLSGLLGVGGGFVIVPALRSYTPLSMHSAVATSLMAIALNSTATVFSSVMMGRAVPVEIALPFAIGSLLGMVIGRLIAPWIAGARLQQGFSLLSVVIAAIMAYRAIN